MDVAARSANAPVAQVVPKVGHWEEQFKAQGVRGKAKRARRVGVDRRTYDRWMKAEVVPSLERALLAANRLDTTVNALWELAA